MPLYNHGFNLLKLHELKNNVEIRVLLEAMSLLQIKNIWNRNSEYGVICNEAADIYVNGCALEKVQKLVPGEKRSRLNEMHVYQRLIYWNLSGDQGFAQLHFSTVNRGHHTKKL